MRRNGPEIPWHKIYFNLLWQRLFSFNCLWHQLTIYSKMCPIYRYFLFYVIDVFLRQKVVDKLNFKNKESLLELWENILVEGIQWQKSLRKGKKVISSFSFSVRHSLTTPQVSNTAHRVQRQSTIFMSKWITLSCSPVVDLHFHEIITIPCICIAPACYKALHLPLTGIESISFSQARILIVVCFLVAVGLDTLLHLLEIRPRPSFVK